MQPRLAQAHSLHRGGRLAEARQLYEAILAKNPRDADALGWLAELLCQTGRFVEAEPLLRRLTSIRPKAAECHFNHAAVCEQLGKTDAAIESYNRSIAVRPEFSDAYFGRGNILASANRLDDALADYDKVVSLDPGDAEPHNNRGSVLRQLNRPVEALAAFDRALTLQPNFVEALNNRGGALRDLAQPREALACFDQALVLRPDFAEAQLNRGNALSDLGQPGEALASYDAALSLRPDYAAAYYDRGNALTALKRFDDAVASYDRALTLCLDYVEAHNNRGIALLALQRPRHALASFDKVLLLQANHAEAFNNRGNALQELNCPEGALESYDRAIALRDDYWDPIKNKAYILLRAGSLEDGWKFYEARKRSSDPVGHRNFAQPLWLGETEIAGKTILVHWEQGFGDTIQFCRYLPELDRLGARVLFAPQLALRGLMRGLTSASDIVDADDPTLEFDLHIPLLSLPLACKTSLATIPACVPYLRAEPGRVETWRAALGDAGFRIGICWQGNSQAPIDRGRSFSPMLFERLSRMGGVRLISLQKGEGESGLSLLPPDMIVETLGEAFDTGPDAFLDAAAVMQHLDLVISSDTAIAHLAGALGRPVWLATKHVPEWRWMMDRPHSPWYPTMRIFRQLAAGDWSSVFAEIEEALQQLIEDRGA